MKPRVSVVTKVLNGERFIQSSVQSILDQTFGDFEFIILDDGSTDDTWAILGNLADQDRRIVLHRNVENMGLPATGNIALKFASAEFLAIQDADDWSYPQRLEKQVRYLEAHPECVAVGSRMLMVNSDDWPIRLWNVPLTHEEIDLYHMNGFGGMLAHPALLARTRSILEIGGYREDYPVSDDYDFLLRLAEVGELHNLTDVLVRYTRHSTNITGSREDLWKFHKMRAVRDAWERRGLGVPDFAQLPNPAMKRSEGSRVLSLLRYGLENIFRHPGSPEGWAAARGAALRLVRKRKAGS